MRHTRFSFLAVAAVTTAVALAAACGGGGGTPTTPGQPTPTPVPTATPRPSPTPTPNPTAGLAPGPVSRYSIKVHSIDTDGGGGQNYRAPNQDAEGRWIVYVGEFIQLDSTQKNANNQICQTVGLPQWILDDPQSVLKRRDGQPNPFVLRIDVVASGEVSAAARVDGVDSNVLILISSKKK